MCMYVYMLVCVTSAGEREGRGRGERNGRKRDTRRRMKTTREVGGGSRESGVEQVGGIGGVCDGSQDGMDDARRSVKTDVGYDGMGGNILFASKGRKERRGSKKGLFCV